MAEIPDVEVGVFGDSEDFNDAIDGSINRLFSMEGAILGVSAALGFMASKAIVNSIQAMADFETAFTGVEKVITATDEQLMNISEGLREMSTQLPITAEDLAGIAEQGGKLGIEAEKIEGFTRTVAKLASVTDIATEEVARGFRKILAQTDATVDDMERLGAIVNEISNQLPSDAEEIVDAVSRAGTSLTSLGLTATDILALIGPLAGVGASARRVGTAFRRLGEQLLTPRIVQELDEAFGQVPGTFRTLIQQSPTRTILALGNAMENSRTAAEKLTTILATPSAKALRLLGANADNVAQSFGITNDQIQDATSLNEEMEVILDNVNAQWKLLQAQVQDIAVEIGQFFKPAVLSLLGILRTGVEVFGDLNRATNGALGAFVLLTGAIFAITIAISSFATIFKITSGTIRTGIAGAFKPLAKAIKFLLPAFILKDWKKFKNLLGKAGDTTKNKLITPLRNAASVLKNIGLAIAGFTIGKLKSKFATLISFVKGKLMGPFLRLRGLLGGLRLFFLSLIPAPLLKAFGKLRVLVGRVLARFGFLRNLFIGLPGILKLVAVALGIALIARLIDVQKAWTSFRGFVDEIIGGIATFLKTKAPKLIGAAFFIIGDTIRGVLLELGRAIIGSDKSIIRRIIGDIVSYFISGDAFSDMKEAAKILFDIIGAAALGLMRGLIGDKDATFKEIFNSIADWLINTAKGILKNAADTALQGIIDSFNSMKKKLIGGSIVPETFSEISAHVKGDFRPEFTGNIQDAVAGAETAFADMGTAPMGRPTGGGRTSVTKIDIGPIHANSREEGRAAIKGISDELRSNGLSNKVD